MESFILPNSTQPGLDGTISHPLFGEFITAQIKFIKLDNMGT